MKISLMELKIGDQFWYEGELWRKGSIFQSGLIYCARIHSPYKGMTLHPTTVVERHIL